MIYEGSSPSTAACVQWSPNNTLIAVGCSNGVIVVLDVSRSSPGWVGESFETLYELNGMHVIDNSQTQPILKRLLFLRTRLFFILNSQCCIFESIGAHTSPIKSIDFDLKTKHLRSNCQHGQLRLWNIARASSDGILEGGFEITNKVGVECSTASFMSYTYLQSFTF